MMSLSFAWAYGPRPPLPPIIAHKGNNLSEIVNQSGDHHRSVLHSALGVFDLLRIVSSFLFGSLLRRAPAPGNYFIQGPLVDGGICAADLQGRPFFSAMTRLFAGSSIAKWLTTGTFTIPDEEGRIFLSEKAVASEVASSVNGRSWRRSWGRGLPDG